MCRSSQPLTGIGGKREKSDEKLINLYRTCGIIESEQEEESSERKRFYILDARSWVAATANKIGRGKGAENASHYGANTYMEFCGTPNLSVLGTWHSTASNNNNNTRLFFSFLFSFLFFFSLLLHTQTFPTSTPCAIP
jgi:hypothetical protein